MKNKLIFIGKAYIIDYPTPWVINYNLSFRILLGILIIIQVITVIFIIEINFWLK